jgi:hypothetical protein
MIFGYAWSFLGSYWCMGYWYGLDSCAGRSDRERAVLCITGNLDSGLL